MSASQAPSEPGWYEDPEGRKGLERYWNGENWSGAPRKRPPQLTSSGILLIVAGSVIGVVVVGLIAFNLFL